jgi:hypothetical protein
MARNDAEATLAELEAEFRTLAGTVDLASARRAVLATLIQRRKAEAGARVKVSQMDPMQREALKTVLNEPG